MKKLLAPLCLAALLLATGCASSETEATPTETAVPSQAVETSPAPTEAEATPTLMAADPTETVSSELTIQEAGELYLSGVCPANEAAQVFADEVNAAVQAGVPLDMAVVISKAAEARDAYRASIDLFSSESASWPEYVREDIDALLDMQYATVAATDQMASAPNQEIFVPVWDAWIDPAAQATTAGVPQKVRAKLELPADAYASCQGR